jgi:hypothetical protein
MMKSILTLLVLISSSIASLAQDRARTPADTKESFEKNPMVIREVSGSNLASEAVTVLNTIRMGLKEDPNTKSIFTEAEYQTLRGNADNFMLQQKYNDALLLYNEILKNKEDQYAKDRILEARALQAKQQKEEEQRKQDEILRAKAEFVASNTTGRYIVHFTGALISDKFSSAGTTKVFDRKDQYSNFLKPGKYNDLSHYLLNANHHTLDGIAIPANTRLIIYKNKNCTGEILLDITSPAIINNGIWAEYDLYKDVNTKEFIPEIQPYFPQATRSWSKSNMHDWTKGSLEIKVEVVD